MDKEVLDKAICIYGTDKQLDMVVEEMSELTKEICKKKRGKDNRVEIIEEIADVYIMLEQLKIICNISQKEIQNIAEVKVKRLNERLENIKNGF